MTLKPENDGVDHINISFIAKSMLGKKLNDFSNVPTWDENGVQYRSAYSYLCYLKTGMVDKRFAMLSSKEAHSLFLSLKRAEGTSEVWVPKLLDRYWKVLRTRIERNDKLRDMFYANELPIVSYIVSDTGVVIHRKIDNGVVNRYNKLLQIKI